MGVGFPSDRPSSRDVRQASLPRLHVVTDDAVLADHGFLETAEAVMEAAGAGMALHVRGPRTTGAELFRVASALRAPARRHGTLLLVNDRVDVAMAASADGAHLGERSLPVDSARDLLGDLLWVGASVHAPDTLASVADAGADFALVGTVFVSASHPGRPGIGPEGLSEILAAAPGIPALGIGGIGVGDVTGVLETGAHGVAILSGIWGRRDPAIAALDYLAALDGAKHRPSSSTDRREAMEDRP